MAMDQEMEDGVCQHPEEHEAEQRIEDQDEEEQRGAALPFPLDVDVREGHALIVAEACDSG
jgi:hypothetical protein